MKVQVYHMWVETYDDDNNKEIPISERKVSFEIIGSVEGENITPEDVWHLTNWSCWGADENNIHCDGLSYKPTKFDRGFTNDDICFYLDGQWWCAKSIGWHNESDFASSIKYLFDNAEWVNRHLNY